MFLLNGETRYLGIIKMCLVPVPQAPPKKIGMVGRDFFISPYYESRIPVLAVIDVMIYLERKNMR